jgi:NADH-quinone oxidoreductase subunit C
MNIELLQQKIVARWGDELLSQQIKLGELTIEVAPEKLHSTCLALRDESDFHFEQLIDVCGVDYLHYGLSDFQTEEATLTGYSRGVETNSQCEISPTTYKPRFAVVYHLLSLKHNWRIRIRSFPPGEPPRISSVLDIWESANWFEREAFDLYGILFDGHPDLRRILTDYGFVGHPFRKDFPLIGHVEMRYDAALKRCVYEPVSIQPRVLVPKVIRHDNRYLGRKDV